jgi:amino acid adenylation domain-containing protein/non-ribosomal peptide synthase protein (TIGR01720 family)
MTFKRIEEALLKKNDVKQAVVIPQNILGSKRLIAYITPNLSSYRVGFEQWIEIETEQGKERVKGVDISQNGLCFEKGSLNTQPNTSLLVRIPEIDHVFPAIGVWENQGLVGIRFVLPSELSKVFQAWVSELLQGLPWNQRLETSSFHRNLRLILKQEMPSLMVPEAIVLLKSFPLTAEGGIDYNSLTLQAERFFAQAQNQSTYGSTHEKEAFCQTEKAYWQKKLEGAPLLINMPHDFSRPVVSDAQGDALAFTFPEVLSHQVKQFSVQQGVSQYTILLAAFYVLVARYSGQEDIIIGAVNLLPLRIQSKLEHNFLNVILGIQKTVLDAQENQDIPFDHLLEVLNIERTPIHHPLFQVAFAFESGASSHGCTLDLTLKIKEEESVLQGEFQFATALFKRGTIQQLAIHFQQLLHALLAEPQARVGHHNLLIPEEHQRVIVEWNQTQQEYPIDKTIYQLFEEQVVRTPEQTAVVFEGQQLTYEQLNRKANQLAHYLRERGVGPDILVAIACERSLEMIVGILGILKAGGAYVPLDPSYPLERMEYMLQDTQSAVVLTQRSLQTQLPKAEVQWVLLDCLEELAHYPETNLTPSSGPDNLAYVIYTSGSTGKPKGVMIDYKNVINTLYALFDTYKKAATPLKISAFTSYAFDVSVSEFFVPLLQGDELHVFSETLRKDVSLISNYINQQQINYAYLPPIVLANLPRISYPSLEAILYAGEPCDRETAFYWSSRVKLYNFYGPTETSIYATGLQLKAGEANLIGKPIANTTTYILDAQHMPQPVGVIGELYIGGHGLARGYLNRSELTTERFIANPFVEGERLYRTGDLCRYLANGSIEYMGRIDHQVKVRGFRIELGEIESALLSHADVNEAVVVAREAEGYKQLVAYYTTQDQSLDAATLRVYLKALLPEYMVPVFFVALESMPITPNGKMDRKALPAPEGAAIQQAYVAPRTETEQILCAIWQEVLHLPQVGIEDNFFELGGESLLAVGVVSRIRNRLNCELSLAALFQNPNIASLAGVLEQEQPPLMQLPLVAQERPERLPLSFAQQRLWFLDQLEPNSSFYNIPTILSIKGPLNLSALEEAIQSLMQRHESLRTSFHHDAAGAYQVIAAQLTPEIRYIDCQKHGYQEVVAEETLRPFDLTQAPLWRVNLIQRADNDWTLLLVFHHSIADGWSMGIILRELKLYYEAAIQNMDVNIAPLVIQYADFTLWQRQLLREEEALYQEQLHYWHEVLSGTPELLNLPLDYPRPAQQDYKGGRIAFTLPSELSAQIKQFSEQNGVTVYMTLLTAFYVLLHRYTGEDDIVIGSPIANRHYHELEGLIGCFINTLALRVQGGSQSSFVELVQQVKIHALSAQAHQDLPFERLVETLHIERSLAHSPLFQVMFNLINEGDASFTLAGLDVTSEALDYPVAKFDLTLAFQEYNGLLMGEMEYASALFKPETIQRMVLHFEHLLGALLSGPEARVTQHGLLLPEEYQHVVIDWNQTEKEYPVNKTIHQLFEEQVARTPTQIAVVFEAQKLSYEALNRKANQLAHYLRTQGVGPDTLVALACERSLEMMVGILGILKAGGAYVPLDPSYPRDRLEYMLSDSQSSVVLTQSSLQLQLLKEDAQWVLLDHLDELLAPYPETNPQVISGSDNLAYVIYTSGSTGKPKGVMIEHRSICDRLFWSQDYIFLSESDVFLQQFSFGFDGAVQSLFWPLVHGATTLFSTNQGLSEPKHLLSLIEKNKATTLFATPSILNALLDEAQEAKFSSVKRMIFGGEALSQELLKKAADKGINELYNFYGPTECSVLSTAINLVSQNVYSVPPIGFPIANTSCHILDPHLNPVPVGVVGELYIGGYGLARGYLNRPELTDERFIANPFAEGRLYRTGDLCRYLEDGAIEYMGRIDHQVKIRGFRIELGEIESALLSYEVIKEAVVVVHEEEQGRKQLVAYFTAHDSSLEITTLRTYLKTRLPEYMVPAFFVALEAMPITPNGKLDRKALPAPEWGMIQQNYVAPSSEVEHFLCAIWQEVLHLPQVGIEDNFFELGGDSILSIQMIARAARQGIQLKVRDVFQYPTIAGLGSIAEHVSLDKPHAVTEHDGEVPLLPIQAWFMEQQFAAPHHFNQSMLLRLTSEVALEHLEQALNYVIHQHDAFRIRYDLKRKKQWYDPEFSGFALEEYDLSTSADFAQAVYECTASLQAGLNVERGPLYRVALIHGAPDGLTRLFLVIHHLIVDGVSWRILFADLEEAYHALQAGKVLSEDAENSSYKDWALALGQEGAAESSLMSAAKAYWLQERTISPMPQDHENSGIREEAEASLTLSQEETHILLKELPQCYHMEINDVLLAALMIAYQQWGHHDELVVHLEGHGRESDLLNQSFDLSRTVGWFTSLYPVYLSLDNHHSLSGILKHIKEQLRMVPGRGLGYGVLRYLANSQVSEQLKRQEQPGLVFNYLGQFQGTDGLFDYAPEAIGCATSTSNHLNSLMEWNSYVHNNQLHLGISYNRSIYEPETIQSFVAAYHEALKRFIAERTQAKHSQWLTHSDIPLAHLTQAEIDRLVPAGVVDVYPLTPLQQGLLYHSIKDQHSGNYIVRFAWVMGQDVQQGLLHKAWAHVVSQYDILRSSFLWQETGEPLHLVHQEVTLPWYELDWQDNADWRSALDAFFAEEGRRGFDISQAPLMRFYWIKLSSQKNLFVFVNHHVLLDGWSCSMMLGKVMEAYHHLAHQKALPHATAPRYRDYVRWVKAQDVDVAQTYWRTLLADVSEPTVLPIKKTVVALEGSQPAFATHQYDLSKEQTQMLQRWTQQHGLTLNTLMQGVWSLVLYRYSGQDCVVFGHVVSGRTHMLPRIEEQVGLLINTIPIKAVINPEQSGLDFLKGLQVQLADSQAHGYLTLTQMQQAAGIDTRMPLVDHLVVFENYPIEKAAEGQVSLSIEETLIEEQTNYSFNLMVIPGETLSCSFSYDTRFYQEQDMVRLMSHVQTMLLALVNEPQMPVAKYPILSPAERHQLLVEWNQTQQEYPVDKTIYQLFEEQVVRTPEQTAVVFEGQQLTYDQLNRKANQLAHYLRERGVGPDILVAIACERSLEMIVGILGVLKAGGAYVPLDPSYPPDRLEYMLRDSQSSIVLSQRTLQQRLPQHDALWIMLDSIEALLAPYPDTNPLSISGASNLAYVIYTSGSTGKPKGVMLEHRGLTNYFDYLNRELRINSEDALLQNTSFSFDVSVEEIFLALLHGAKLIIPLSGQQFDPLYLHKTITKNRITILEFVPSLLEELISSDVIDFSSVRAVLCGGAALSVTLLNKTHRCIKDAVVLNAYGPTETTIGSTFYSSRSIHSGVHVSIGRPMSNTSCYILDPNLTPVPIGVVGELYIGGDGLARGYLNRPELTAERFITNPFAEGRLYRTGDLCRYLEDGAIEYMGRIDHQVKIRGFRIELGEIESALLSYEGIKEAVVVVREEEQGNKQLVAYYTAQDLSIEAAALRASLKGQLPDYMIPAFFVALEAMPLSPNGKLDSKALPPPEYERAMAYYPPRDEIELILIQLWEEVLGVKHMGITANFFEMGGHSLLTIILIGKINRYFNTNLHVSELITHPTVEEFQTLVRAPQTAQSSSIIPLKCGDGVSLFCIHPVGGQSLCYLHLSQCFSGDSSLYGVQQVLKPEQHNFNIEKMAEDYIRELKNIQPKGPYYLAGWSMGGVIAHEMAYQLECQGEQIAYLGLIDSYIPEKMDYFNPQDHLVSLSIFAEDLWGRHGKVLEENEALMGKGLTPTQYLEQLLLLAKRDKLVPEETSEADLMQFYEYIYGNLIALNHYETKVIQSPMVLYGTENVKNNPSANWEFYTKAQVIRHQLDGNHYTILTKPNVEYLAASIEIYLDLDENK